MQCSAVLWLRIVYAILQSSKSTPLLCPVGRCDREFCSQVSLLKYYHWQWMQKFMCKRCNLFEWLTVFLFHTFPYATCICLFHATPNDDDVDEIAEREKIAEIKCWSWSYKKNKAFIIVNNKSQSSSFPVVSRQRILKQSVGPPCTQCAAVTHTMRELLTAVCDSQLIPYYFILRHTSAIHSFFVRAHFCALHLFIHSNKEFSNAPLMLFHISLTHCGPLPRMWGPNKLHLCKIAYFVSAESERLVPIYFSSNNRRHIGKPSSSTVPGLRNTPFVLWMG